MLTLDINRVFRIRGIANPYSQLTKLGISRPTAANLLNGRVKSIHASHLEKICEFLKCEPSDLYTWRPDNDTANVEDHPLKGLRRDDQGSKFRELVRTIPLERIAEAEALLAGLRSESES